MSVATCSECNASLGNPNNLTHLVTDNETMLFGMNCGSCNAMNEVHTEVTLVKRV